MEPNDFFALIAPILADDRDFDLRKIGDRYIARAVPLDFEGGPIPEDWRAEGTEPLAVVAELLAKFQHTASDFNWFDDDEDDDPHPVLDAHRFN